MTHPELPDDLTELERQLIGRPRPGPPADLRQRVLAAVSRELHRPPTRRATGQSGWRAAAVAAAALAWINLSMSVANNMNWGLWGRGDRDGLEVVAGRIQALLPEIPEREAYGHALLLHAGATLAPAPDLRAFPEHLLLREHESWDMR
jgi:hypothetical protein